MACLQATRAIHGHKNISVANSKKSITIDAVSAHTAWDWERERLAGGMEPEGEGVCPCPCLDSDEGGFFIVFISFREEGAGVG